MSNRIRLTPDKVTATLFEKIEKLKGQRAQKLIVEIFKDLETRRKCYKLGELQFKPHATEYLFPNFYAPIHFAGRKISRPNGKDVKVLTLLQNLSKLCRELNITEIDYDGIMDSLESITDHDLASGQLACIIPEMVYGYTTTNQADALILKLEYFTGSTIIDILDAHYIETNTGKKRINNSRASRIAKEKLNTVIEHDKLTVQI